jgi:glycine hydroxymethyltransferase
MGRFWGPDFSMLEREDPEIADVVLGELARQRDGLQLIASENFTSPAVLAALGSTLTNKYAEGYPGHRYYGGCAEVDRAEDLGIRRAKELFGAEHANLQPHSGASANLAAYAALVQPGDTVLAMDLPHSPTAAGSTSPASGSTTSGTRCGATPRPSITTRSVISPWRTGPSS